MSAVGARIYFQTLQIHRSSTSTGQIAVAASLSIDFDVLKRIGFPGLGNSQCHQPKLQPCPRQAPRSSQPPWPSGDDQASAAQSGGLAGLAVM
ncbi:hypothetical protein DY994_31705 [Pseudomonas aeruginosa]|nr:hypothetical protein [Pseudomonas aeruginosa]NRH44847.1 hypothetical protein [Pseudomonas sp. MS15a(2019)]RTV90455.1 hypothetical protein DY994_31705 [Pseudomonas aeruginosa]TEH32198.1 hypothetical protein IPC1320_32450 [Pseudomonas aeruginosa]